MSRLAGRLAIFGRAVPRLVGKPWRRRPAMPRRILIAHHLLLGDTLMLTPLLAKLRRSHPAADIVFACPKAVAPLYAGRPYGVDAQPFDPRDPRSVRALLAQGPFDLAIVPGDNRHAWLALAAGSRWIVAHTDDIPAWKNWPVDEAVPYPHSPCAWGDMAAQLADGAAPAPYDPTAWPAPPHAPFAQPDGPYAVLHLGASSPLKLWPAERWLALADWLAARGVAPVWSGGPNETALVAAADPQQRHVSLAGQLDLPQLWALLAGARLLVCPDTGVAHLARLVGTPTVALFGPGSPQISGAGEFWRDSPFIALSAPIPCRDQTVLFRRERAWIQRCGRGVADCPLHDDPAQCMRRLSLAQVCESAVRLLTGEAPCAS
ncbi:glycosyltransferase family 9 protein [Chitiniphilus purpureus]|uniref:Glycosyltransferase family 9 protein n=1 Tax=Chitiniphilus purpureus TaxID=2981137 RepID=A0ABY6DMH3_9NEIS|nr:glycosyltransferase family 9 protein [Chitiniphilus sp. CD1]UXY15570.1 glycosyltransferase family 9 protein [Chitiniphilus sp. CD1]